MTESLPQPPDMEPASLSSSTFGRARRGFEPAEVNQLLGRAADALRAWQERDHAFRSRIEELEAQLIEARKLDEGRIASVLGEETARIVSAAREAAAEIRSKASDDAENLVKEAQESSTATANALTAEAEALRAEAESMRDDAAHEYSIKVDEARARHDELLAEAQERHDELISTAETTSEELVSAAQERHDKLLAEAQERHDELISTAESRNQELVSAAERVLVERTAEANAEAEEIVEGARSQGRAMVAEAKDVRDRILADLAERRRIARKQIEGAVAGRDSIIDVLQATGASVSAIVADLRDADKAARDHANHIAELLPDDSAEFLAGLDVTDRIGDQLISVRGSDDGGEVADVGIVSEDLIGSSPDGEVDAPGIVEGEIGPDTDAGAAEAFGTDAAVVEPIPADGGLADDGVADDEAMEESNGDAVAGAEDFALHPGGASESEVDGVIAADLIPGVEAAAGEAVDDVAGDATEPADDMTVSDRSSNTSGDATVHDLFAKIRAQGIDGGSDDPDTDEDEDLEDDLYDDIESEDPDADEVEHVEQDGVVIDLSSIDSTGVDQLSRVADLLDARDELLVPVERQMLRALRRLASDEQNEVLDRLRRIKRGRPDMDDVVPTAEEMMSTFSDGMIADFSAAIRAGFDFWVDAGGVTEMASFVVPADVRTRLEDVMTGFISVHRAHLERSMEQLEESGSGPDELTTVIKSVYRDWRQSALTEMAGDLAIAGFSHGERTAAGPGVPWMWVVDNGGLPCADGEDNALAGPVLSDEAFPTGDLVPPAHSGCRCILVPADQ